MPKLRDYQTESINGLRDGIKKGHKRQILCASTGAGKSICAVELLKRADEKESKALFVVDRRVLVRQFSQHLENYNIKHGIIMAGHGKTKANIQIASAQTLERCNSWPVFDLIIIDEIHACFRQSIKKLIELNPDAAVLGLTATPFTKGLGKVFSNVVNVISMKELVDKGHLVPFKVFVAHEIDTEGLGLNTKGEWKDEELESRAKLIIGDVVSDYLKISNQVWGETRKTICFSSGVSHGIELSKQFASVGKNFVSISYLDDEDYKHEVLRKFAKPTSDIDGVISTDILTRGYDQTDIEHVIVARPLRKSLALHIQMIGRGARSHPGKEFCVLQCNSGNYLRFKDDFDDIYVNGIHELNEGKEKPKQEMSKKEKKELTCPKCMALMQSLSCVVCGYEIEKRPNIEIVHGVMTELNGTVTKEAKEKYSGEYKKIFYQQLLGYSRQHRYDDGWAYHKYREKFDAKPKWEKKPLNPGIDVLNFIKSRQIAYAKRKKVS